MNNPRDVNRTQRLGDRGQQTGDRTQQLGDRTQRLGDRTQQISPPTVVTPSAPPPPEPTAWSDEQPAASYGHEYASYGQPPLEPYYDQQPQYHQQPPPPQQPQYYTQPPAAQTEAPLPWYRKP